jgi:hypothetical protein
MYERSFTDPSGSSNVTVVYSETYGMSTIRRTEFGDI